MELLLETEQLADEAFAHEREDQPTRASVAPPSAGLPRWIGVGYFPGKGRGVVALRDIPTDELIERSPVLIIPAEDRALTDRTTIFHYVFMWEHDTTEQDLYNGTGRAGIALGVSSLLNHSKEPNARFVRNIDAMELELWSLKPIKAGDEVTIDYGMDLWFEPDA